MLVTSLMLSSLGETVVYLRTSGRLMLQLIFLQPCLESRARLEQAACHVARERFFRPQGDAFGVGVIIWRRLWQTIPFVIILCQEFFLVKSLVSCNILRKQGVIDNFYFISLVTYGENH